MTISSEMTKDSLISSAECLNQDGHRKKRCPFFFIFNSFGLLKHAELLCYNEESTYNGQGVDFNQVTKKEYTYEGHDLKNVMN